MDDSWVTSSQKLGHDKRSDHFRKSLFKQMYSQENYYIQCIIKGRKRKFAAELIEDTVTGSIPIIYSSEGSRRGVVILFHTQILTKFTRQI